MLPRAAPATAPRQPPLRRFPRSVHRTRVPAPPERLRHHARGPTFNRRRRVRFQPALTDGAMRGGAVVVVMLGEGATPSLPSSTETFMTTLLLSLRARTGVCWDAGGAECIGERWLRRRPGAIPGTTAPQSTRSRGAPLHRLRLTRLSSHGLPGLDLHECNYYRSRVTPGSRVTDPPLRTRT